MSTTALAAVNGGQMALSDIREMAKAAAASGLFPQLKTPEAVFTLMMLAQSEGLHPIQALRRFDIVQGRPALKSDAMLGEFQQHGGVVEWLENSAEKCSASFASPGLAKPVTVTWTIDDAKKAGLAGKPGPWQQYPRQMLRARVISEGVRMSMPAVVVGLYAPEEVQDFRPVAVVEAEITPAPKAMAARYTEAVSAPTAPTTVIPSNDAPSEPATPADVKALNIALKSVVGDDREKKLAWLSARTGREIASSKSLSHQECLGMIAQARKEAAAQEREPGMEG